MMKTINSVRLILLSGFLLGSGLFFTSCSKEGLQQFKEQKDNAEPQLQGQAATAKMESVTSNAAITVANKPTIPSPDTSLNLLPNGVYFIQWMAKPELNKVLEVDLNIPGTALWNIANLRNDNWKTQWWSVTNLGDGYYSITNYFLKTALEAEVYGEMAWATGRTVSRAYSGFRTQQWRIATSASTGNSRIYNRQTGMALVNDGFYMAAREVFLQWASNSQDRILKESWKFIPKP